MHSRSPRCRIASSIPRVPRVQATVESVSVMNEKCMCAQTLLVAVMLMATACGGGRPSTSAGSAEPSGPAAQPTQDDPLPPSELETQLPEAVRQAVLNPFTGDFNEMLQRRVVRIGVEFNRTFYFVDKGVQRGVGYEYGRLMEDRINEKSRSGNIKVHVFFVPLSREELLSALISGKVDLVAGEWIQHGLPDGFR